MHFRDLDFDAFDGLVDHVGLLADALGVARVLAHLLTLHLLLILHEGVLTVSVVCEGE